jgi:hypothetical protein
MILLALVGVLAMGFVYGVCVGFLWRPLYDAWFQGLWNRHVKARFLAKEIPR